MGWMSHIYNKPVQVSPTGTVGHNGRSAPLSCRKFNEDTETSKEVEVLQESTCACSVGSILDTLDFLHLKHYAFQIDLADRDTGNILFSVYRKGVNYVVVHKDKHSQVFDRNGVISFLNKSNRYNYEFAGLSFIDETQQRDKEISKVAERVNDYLAKNKEIRLAYQDLRDCRYFYFYRRDSLYFCDVVEEGKYLERYENHNLNTLFRKVFETETKIIAGDIKIYGTNGCAKRFGGLFDSLIGVIYSPSVDFASLSDEDILAFFSKLYSNKENTNKVTDILRKEFMRAYVTGELV